MRTILNALVGGALVVGLSVGIAPPSSADRQGIINQQHTPSSSASCKGVTVTARSYEAKDTNVLGVVLDGVVTEREFETNDTLTVAVPQDGEQHTWSSYVRTSNRNASYSREFGPSTLTCGERTPITAAEPVVTPPTCKVAGTVTWPAFEHGHWTGDLANTPGTHTATPVADKGYVLTNPGPVTVIVGEKFGPGRPCIVKPPPVKKAHPKIKIVDKCSCRRDSVTVKGKHLKTAKVTSLPNNRWRVRVVADDGWTVPTTIRGNKYAKSATYIVRTTDKKCPCRRTGTCEPKHPTPPKPPCGCKP